jgi:two-component system response regulator AtoC
MAIEKVLVVDDEPLIRNFLAETLRRKNLDVTTADNGQQAVKILKDQVFDLVITDMMMPGLTGIDVLKKVKELSPSTIVVVITAYGSIENAVEAMRLGAFNYLIKPFSPDNIEALIDKAGEHLALVNENQFLRTEARQKGSGSVAVVGQSPQMLSILQQVQQVAKSNANVFITGESGTGKEVIAHAIHTQSPRAQGPFIKVNCAAVPETLIESEFFGHEKGAFTGANAKRLGRFELAHGGTLLLDEITEVPIGLQAKLLRVIQEQEFERVGGSKPVKVDVRILSTSNRDIQAAIREKVLREDLFYRLNVVPIHLSPLRERIEDIPLLAEYFLEKFSRENHSVLKKLTEEARQKLLAYPWPGNVRELANIIERAVVMNSEASIRPEHLCITCAPQDPPKISLQELEKRMIIEAMEAQQHNQTKAAKALGMTLKMLKHKLQHYSIDNTP